MCGCEEEMKMSKPRISPLWLIFLLPGFRTAADSGDCCRPLTKQIWYLHPSYDAVPKYEADVLKVDYENAKTVLLIHTSGTAPVRTSGWSEYHQARSSDMGKTWEPIPQDVPTPLGVSDSLFLEAPSDPKFLYRYVRELGIYLRSEDAGLSWILPRYLIGGVIRDALASRMAGTNNDTVRFEIIGIHPTNPRILFASLTLAPWTAVTLYYPDFKQPAEGSSKEFDNTYISSDGGESWEKFTPELRPWEAIGISTSQPKVFYGHGRKGMVKSTDGGVTWAPVGQQHQLELRPLTSADKNEETRLLKGLVDLRVRQILVEPSNENVVYLVSNKGLIRSMDGGSTWCLLDLGFDELDSVKSVGLNPAKSTEIFVGTTRGVFYSSDRGCHFFRIYPQPANR
jgi:hypothetical protein